MISVVIAAYGEAELLRAALHCLAQQDFASDFEIIVCDDGSSNDLSAIVKDTVARKDIELRYVWQPRAGFRAGLSRNNGIRLARGEILVFLDGDMLVNKDFLNVHARHHDGSRRVVCGTRTNFAVSNESQLRDRLAEINTIPIGKSKEALRQQKWLATVPWMSVLGCNFSVPRAPEVLFDENLVGWGSDDRELAIRLVHEHSYHVTMTHDARGLHMNHLQANTDVNPFRTLESIDIVGFLRNKLYLYDRHPDINVTPALSLLLNCHLDAAADTWTIGNPKPGRSLVEVIQEARDWFNRRQHITEGSQPRA